MVASEGGVVDVKRLKHTLTLIPGDGIGPEVAAATQRVLEAIKVKHGEMLATVDAELAGRAKPADGNGDGA